MLDRDPNEGSHNNVCVMCHKPIDDHCLKHGPNGIVLCPGLDGKTPCQLTGPAHIESFI